MKMLKESFKNKRILNIVINYSNEEEVIKYAKELTLQSIVDELVLIIVINKSTDEGLMYLASELEFVSISSVIFNPYKNLGYLSGAFYGFREFQDNYDNIVEMVIVSNTDILIADNLFMEKLLSKSYSSDVKAISPSVFQTSTKSYENPHYLEKISKTKLDFLIWIFSNPFLSFLYLQISHAKSRFVKTRKPKSSMIYQGHGCFFILKREFMEYISFDNYPGFMYSEESYISELLLEKDYKWFYDSDLEVKHIESTVTSLLSMSQKSKYYRESLSFIRDNFYKGR